jgi:tetratricopeptide (TPR) repeat protein
MAPFDRESALKTAEKALRQGRIDAAIAEYVRIVDAQPRDWNSANALGDLYVRASQVDKAVAQYTRIADHLATEGFYPKAAALFKKILKVKPADEYALLQSGEIAAKQGLLADAKNAFKAVAEGRRSRGDKKGAAAISIRIGMLDPEDLEARLAAAKAAAEIGDTLTALGEFREVARKLDSQGKTADALNVLQLAHEMDPANAEVRGQLLNGYLQAGDVVRARKVAEGPAALKRIASALEAAGHTDEMLEVLAEVARLDPGDLQVRAGLAQAYAGQGDLQKAREYLSPETAGKSAPLWLTLAEIELSSGRFDEGRAAVVTALNLDSSQRVAAIALGCALAEKSAEAGYPCLDAVADHALAEKDYAAAAGALHEFVTRVRDHIVALMRLVEICVDGGLEATMYEAQAQLADAYLGVGRGLEARIISEDLVAREPWNRANIERFRRALVMLGETDPDGIIAERLSGESPFLATDKMDLNEGVFFDDEPGAPGAQGAQGAQGASGAPGAPGASGAPGAAGAAGTPQSLDQVFEQMRDEAGRGAEEEAAAEQFGLGLTYKELGMEDEAIQAFEVAARSPRQRFEAASALGQLYLERGDTGPAIEWFLRAAEAPASSPDAGYALLYNLADTLEKARDHARALAIFVELEAESGGYRDVASRVDRLSKVQAKG